MGHGWEHADRFDDWNAYRILNNDDTAVARIAITRDHDRQHELLALICAAFDAHTAP